MPSNYSELVSPQRLDAFFSPKSVALVGATDKSGWSLAAFANLNIYKFPGQFYLVNPRGIDVHGSPSYKTVLDIPGEVDLAYLMVPTRAVYDVLGQCNAKGIKNVVVLAAGFGEMGEEGKALERQILDYCNENGMTMLGPNGLGFINAAKSLTPYGLPIPNPLIGGNVGMILQSGGLASMILAYAQARNVGLSTMMSMGNETQIHNTDVMRWMVEDPQTKVIAMFIESIRDTEAFVEVAQQALLAGKPVVALKVGRSEAGARVAKAHTGSLVGDDAVVDTVFRQNGVIRVDSLEDLVNTSGLLASLAGPLPGRRFGFVTASGGACEIISDRSADEGLEIPDFADETKAKLAAIVPDFGAIQNPLDVTGYILVNPTMLADSLRAVQDDPGIDVIVMMNDLPKVPPPDPAPVIAQFTGVAQLIKDSRKPVVLLGGTSMDVTPWGREVAEKTGFPYVLGGIDHGVSALGAALRWGDARAALLAAPAGAAKPAPIDAAAFAASRGIGGRGTWAEHHAAAFLAGHGVPVVPQELVADADAAVAAAERVGYPVVVKLAADDIEHKSDIGGVKLNIGSPEQVRQAFDEVVAAGRGAGGEVVGALVQPMRPPGVELLVGIVTDPAWGHVLAVGFGGVWVEILRDTALRALPVDRGEVLAALRSLRGAKIFEGYRGSDPVNLDNVADAVTAVATLAVQLGDQLESLEINPLLVRGDSVEALDALITWRS
ncbi:MAG: acetate--CoA ligase family protein [Frankiaceae bacterium]|jgi:acyl-CoA synthetase (NDP forming)|nr:acetate--CoA ligase family protein [Frankiaceae bacterium]